MQNRRIMLSMRTSILGRAVCPARQIHLRSSLRTAAAQPSKGKGDGPHRRRDEDWDGDFGGDGLSFSPPPSNLPTNEDDVPAPDCASIVDSALSTVMKGARERYDRLIEADKEELLKEIPNCHVILFENKLPGGGTEQGIYSMVLQGTNEATGETERVNLVIAWEDRSDAERAAGQLTGYTDRQPILHRMPTWELIEFAVRSGYEVQLEPTGSLFIVPDEDFGKTDWERSMDIRSRGIETLPEDPRATSEASEADAMRDKLERLMKGAAAEPQGPTAASASSSSGAAPKRPHASPEGMSAAGGHGEGQGPAGGAAEDGDAQGQGGSPNLRRGEPDGSGGRRSGGRGPRTGPSEPKGRRR